MQTEYTGEDPLEFSPDDEPLTETGILIVDEDPAFQLGLKTFLKEYVGFEKVFTARNGKEAIQLIQDEVSIELLTVDYQMPEMDGLEMLRHLQHHSPRPLGVTMITGFPSEELKTNYANCSTPTLLTKHFLAKPVEFEKLEPIILDCYEELKRAERLIEATADVEEVEDDLEEEPHVSPLAGTEMAMRLAVIEGKIDANANAIRELNPSGCGTFFLDTLKLIIAATVVLLGWSLMEKRNWIPDFTPSTPSSLLENPAPAPPDSNSEEGSEALSEFQEPSSTPSEAPSTTEEEAP